MRRAALWLGGAAVTAIVWLAAPELQWPARGFLALLLGPAPVAFLIQAETLREIDSLPRKPVYAASVLALWVLAIITLTVAAYSGFTGRVMGLHFAGNLITALWVGFALLGSGAVVAAFKAFGFQDAPIMRDIVPVTPGEKLLFVVLAVSAGICEELAFRSFLVPALLVATGSLVGAVVLSSATFGVLHAHQRAGGAARAALMGVVLCIPLIATGSIIPGMIAHVAIDLLGGLWLARWLLR